MVKLIALAAEKGAQIICTRDYHPHDHLSFMDQGGPFPSHCVMGHEGSFFFPPIKTALEAARKKGAEVQVVYKGFDPKVDSFGAAPYTKEYFSERKIGYQCEPDTKIGGGCPAIDWSGAYGMPAANLKNDLDAPPDIMAIFDRKPIMNLTKDKKRLFGVGLAMDFCVLDSCVNFATAKLVPEVYMIVDATRAAHIPGLGTFGSGFLSDPESVTAKMAKAGAKFVYSSEVQK
jgi:nicotinamidase-related amidase